MHETCDKLIALLDANKASYRLSIMCLKGKPTK